jgi:ribosome-binding factor A
MKHEKDAAGAQAAHRHQRVEHSILEELRAILRDDVTDPELEGVRLTALVLAPDSKSARVHFAVPRGRPRSAVERAFTRATSFLRARLTEAVELKRTPDLRFVYESEIVPGEPPPPSLRPGPSGT